MGFGVFRYAYSDNIGDEIQTIAASRFLPRIDILVERDRLYLYKDYGRLFVISNGWFTHLPYQDCWPPPLNIHLLFVSFFALTPEYFINENTADYFKSHAPIGCRSLPLVEKFQEIGVEAYFSGCLTLTLPKSTKPRSEQIYAVDMDQEMFTKYVPEKVRACAIHLTHDFPPPDWSNTSKVYRRNKDLLTRALNKFDRHRHFFASYREQVDTDRHALKLKLAEHMLDRYAEATLVITSRLHVAMPCLALGTPVLLLRSGDLRSDPRFMGLLDLVRWGSSETKPPPIDWHDPEPNSDTYLKYAEALTQRCRDAVSRVS